MNEILLWNDKKVKIVILLNIIHYAVYTKKGKFCDNKILNLAFGVWNSYLVKSISSLEDLDLIFSKVNQNK